MTAPTLCICQRDGGTCTHLVPVPAMHPALPLPRIDSDTPIGYAVALCLCGHPATRHRHGRNGVACDPNTCGCRIYRPSIEETL